MNNQRDGQKYYPCYSLIFFYFVPWERFIFLMKSIDSYRNIVLTFNLVMFCFKSNRQLKKTTEIQFNLSGFSNLTSGFIYQPEREINQ